MATVYKKKSKSTSVEGNTAYDTPDAIPQQEENAKPIADTASESYSASIPHGGGMIQEFKTAVGTSFVKHKDGAEENKSEPIAVAKINGPHANIGVKMGRTINTGNFSSSKIEVSFHAPCEMSEDDANATFDFAVQWVDAKMSELIDKYTT